jgi:hypothetical protein
VQLNEDLTPFVQIKLIYLFFPLKVRRAFGHVYNDLSPIGQRALLFVQIAVNVILLTYCTIPFPLLRFDLGYQFLK